MRYIKLTTRGEIIGFDVLGVCDVHQAKDGHCLLIDVAQAKYLSPATDGKWERIDQRQNTCESAHMLQ